MKSISLSRAIALALLFGAFFAHAQPRKRALLAGAGNYPPASGWSVLNAASGVQMMRSTLLQQGFQDNDILVLTDAAATRAGISQAFQNHLIQQSAPGDIAVFHFYGHGCQVPDDNGDEIDQADEAIAPYDSEKPVAGPIKNFIRDDELSEWTARLREKAGPSGQVLVLLDACHTGTGVRAGENGDPATSAETHSLAKNTTAPGEAALAPMVAFFSSAPQQKSLEITWENGEKCALLTWAFCKSMTRIRPESTYRGLFEQIALLITAKINKQTPQAEGALDMRVFGEKVTPPPPYFNTYTSSANGREIRLRGGLMHGLQPGTEVALYPPETRDTATVQPIAKGYVMDEGAGLIECRVALDRPLTAGQLAPAWTFITLRRFNGYNISIRLAIGDPVQEKAVRERLASMPSVRWSDDNPELTVAADKDNRLLLLSADRTLVWKTDYAAAPPETALKALQDAIGNYMQAGFLRNLEFDGTPYHIDFDARAEATASTPVAAGLTLRRDKDVARLRVANRSPKTVYYTILDIDGANKVTVLLPPEGRSPNEYALAPNESREHRVKFDTPGREVLKLIATPVSIDLRPAIASRGRSTQGRTFFENLFSDTFLRDGDSRGPLEVYKGNEAGVETVVIEVRE